MILTATEVTLYSNISATVGTIISKKLIESIQETVVMKTNNYFVTELYVAGSVEFNPSARTITSSGSFEDMNFLAGDDIFVYNSYRNDGYYTVESVNENILTLVPGSIIVDELSGVSVIISVVKWPLEIKKIVAEMIAYDYDVRPKKRGLSSRSLGPLSESWGEALDDDGYPVSITGKLSKYTIARLM